MLRFRRKPRVESVLPKWMPGDFVRISTQSFEDFGQVDHAGELGVIIKSVAPTLHKDSAAYGKGWYHHVWFGPHTGVLSRVPPEHNWRGYYDEWLDDVTFTYPWRLTTLRNEST